MEAAFVLARFLQYAAASILFGSTLLILWARLDLRGVKPLVAGAGVVLTLAAAAGLVAQTALLAGSLAEAVRPETLVLVMQTMDFGPAAAVRVATGLAVVLIIAAVPGRQALVAVLGSGAIACVSFAWSSHAAATEGPLRSLHVASDAAHALAAAGWVGALVVLALMAGQAVRDTGRSAALADVMTRFSALGMLLVAVLVVTGLVNGWLIFGLDAAIVGTPYGLILAAKLLVFAVMIALAAYHRQWLIGALHVTASGNNARIVVAGRARRSLAGETLAGFIVLALVAALGTLSPLG